MSPIEKFLLYLSQFHPLSAELSEYLSISLSEGIYPRNHILLKEGEIPNCLWYLSKGSARFSRFNEESFEDVTIWFWASNEIILPLNGLQNREKSSASICLNECSCVLSISYIHLKHLHKLFPEYHLISQGFLEHLAAKLTAHLDLVQHSSSLNRYRQLIKKQPALFQHGNLKDIASFLGMSISTIKHLRYEQ